MCRRPRPLPAPRLLPDRPRARRGRARPIARAAPPTPLRPPLVPPTARRRRAAQNHHGSRLSISTAKHPSQGSWAGGKDKGGGGGYGGKGGGY